MRTRYIFRQSVRQCVCLSHNLKAVAGRRVRFLGIGRRVEVGEKKRGIGRSQSHLKVACTFIQLISIRPGAG